MNDKPVWLLDIDGVINACARDYPFEWGSSTWHTVAEDVGIDTFLIKYSTKVIDFINDMSEYVDIRWHTTWQENALALADRIGLKPFPVSELGPNTYKKMGGWISPFDWWKLEAAIEVVNTENRPLIWTDDDLEPCEILNFVRATGVVDGLCLVRPYTNEGLTRRDCVDIGHFVQEALYASGEEYKGDHFNPYARAF